jgi:ribosomal protein S18 acetylase RimI-like enzyme
VRASNDGAIALYETLRYYQAGVRRGYYQDGEDAVVMTKRIQNSEF